MTDKIIRGLDGDLLWVQVGTVTEGPFAGEPVFEGPSASNVALNLDPNFRREVEQHQAKLAEPGHILSDVDIIDLPAGAIVTALMVYLESEGRADIVSDNAELILNSVPDDLNLAPSRHEDVEHFSYVCAQQVLSHPEVFGLVQKIAARLIRSAMEPADG